MRGRKKIYNAKNEVISIRITKKQKEILSNNDWIKKELNAYVRTYLQSFVLKD